jgi:hypothetical protein
MVMMFDKLTNEIYQIFGFEIYDETTKAEAINHIYLTYPGEYTLNGWMSENTNSFRIDFTFKNDEEKLLFILKYL